MFLAPATSDAAATTEFSKAAMSPIPPRPKTRTARLAAVAAPPDVAAAPAFATPAEAAAAPAAVDPAQRVLRQFRLVFNSVKTHFQQVERRAGLGGAQVWALAIIRDQPGVGVNGLARAMDVRQPTASNLVKSLLDQGHIESRKEGADRRAVQLYLRPPGVEVLQRTPGPFSGVLPQVLATLDGEILQRLERDLAALIRALEPDERGAGIPLGEL